MGVGRRDVRHGVSQVIGEGHCCFPCCFPCSQGRGVGESLCASVDWAVQPHCGQRVVLLTTGPPFPLFKVQWVVQRLPCLQALPLWIRTLRAVTSTPSPARKRPEAVTKRSRVWKMGLWMAWQPVRPQSTWQ